MNIVCLDVEGVLVPEIWIAFSEATGLPELRITTRDEPDYDKLMRYRLEILRTRPASDCGRSKQSSPASSRCPARRTFWTSSARRRRSSCSATPSSSLPAR
jgi:phosphoserine/homoserine phosphotransferase